MKLLLKHALLGVRLQGHHNILMREFKHTNELNIAGSIAQTCHSVKVFEGVARCTNIPSHFPGLQQVLTCALSTVFTFPS